jgi:uncharacterized protein (TIGR02996 family)
LQAEAAVRAHRLQAARGLRHALSLQPRHEEVRLRLGRVLLELGQTEEGRSLLEGVRTQSRERRRLYIAQLLLGGHEQRQGRIETAIAAYREAVAQEPNCQTARLALAQALDEQGQAEAARELVRAALMGGTADPDHVDPWRSYPFGRAGEAGVLLAELRRGVRP